MDFIISLFWLNEYIECNFIREKLSICFNQCIINIDFNLKVLYNKVAIYKKNIANIKKNDKNI